MTRLRSICFALAMPLVLALATANLAKAAENTKVTFIVVSDIYKMSGGKTRGGFARLATLVKNERAKGGNVVYVLAGDYISPSIMSGFDKGAHIIDLFNMEPPDFAVPGNHEFDFGEEVFAKRVAESNFPYLAANLRDANGQPLPNIGDTKMLTFGDVKIGLIGLATENSPVTSSPGSLTFMPAVETALAQGKALRADGADLVAVLVHEDLGLDMELVNTRAFDFVWTGHDHDLTTFYNGKTALAESREEAELVVIVDVDITVGESRGKRQVRWWPNFRIIDTANIEPDKDVLARVKTYEDQLSDELDVVIGSTETELDSQKATVRGGESAMGSLVADSLRAAAGADVGLTNGGGIRGNKIYDAGTKLTRRDILTELPFGNVTVKLEMTGAMIREALENGVSQIENAAGRFPHVSGMSFEMDAKQPAGSRILSVMVAGKPLDDGATYTLATNNYMANGGDGYTILKKAKVLVGPLEGNLMANDVMVYVRKMGTISPKVEGRIMMK
ncbi:5'-nucleotidase [hydrothermal vent metagenome]|uniref:5'-nucleotidase n=1 Tax=hydrothermal vent metagenome TaxID=652676 RepID=A0A3B0TG55_9ZZZZ